MLISFALPPAKTMIPASTPLIALPGPDDLPAWNPKNPALCVSASWSMGGAQKICAEWLAACSERGRRAELAIVWPKAEEMWIHPAWKVIRRHPSQTVRHFLGGLALDWAARYPGCPASAHLLNNDALAFLAEGGARAIPVLHNDPAGWNGAPESWTPSQIPMALGCAPFVQKAGAESNPSLHWSNIRHIPSSWRSAKAQGAGLGLRNKWKIPENAKLLLCLGSFKTQKNYPMAARVLKELANLGHDAYLAILGGVSAGDGEALAETVAEAKALGVASRMRLPGFVADPGAFIACSDLLLNVSLYEGFPMAAVEALQSGLPALVPDFPGFQGFSAQGLCLYPAGSQACEVARLASQMLSGPRPPFDSVKRCPRLWNMQFALRPKDPAAPPLDGGALFVTANLNMGGAQRSLVNLLGHWDASPPPFPVALAVCADSNQPDFPRACAAFKSIRVFKIGKPDAIDCAENILDLACRSGCKSIVFWNADVKLKLLLAKFAPPGLRICDVSPGDYAFERITAQPDFCQSITFGPEDYGARHDLLVQKWDSPAPPFIRSKTLRIPNGAQAPAFLSPEPPCGARLSFWSAAESPPAKKLKRSWKPF